MVIFALFGCVKVPTFALHTSIDTPMLLDNHFVLGLNCICKCQRLVRFSLPYNFHNYLDGCSQFYTSSVAFRKHRVTRSLFVNTTYLKQHCTVDFHSVSTNQLHFTTYVHSIYRYIDIVVKDYLTIDNDVTYVHHLFCINSLFLYLHPDSDENKCTIEILMKIPFQ